MACIMPKITTMKTKSKILLFISIFSILLFSVMFLLNINSITTLINRLNGVTNNQIEEINPNSLKPQITIKLVNTPAMGKYKINISNDAHNGYFLINKKSIKDQCEEIIKSEGKSIIVSTKDNLNTYYFCSLLQMVAGDDYEHVRDFFIDNFKEEDCELAKTNFNLHFSNIFNMEVNDIPYANLKIPATKFLNQSGLTNDQVNQLIIKLKENCD